MYKTWLSPSPKKLGVPKPAILAFFDDLTNLKANSAKYLWNETWYRQSGNGVGNYKGFPNIYALSVWGTLCVIRGPLQ